LLALEEFLVVFASVNNDHADVQLDGFLEKHSCNRELGVGDSFVKVCGERNAQLSWGFKQGKIGVTTKTFVYLCMSVQRIRCCGCRDGLAFCCSLCSHCWSLAACTWSSVSRTEASKTTGEHPWILNPKP
jgi:hypothetical protein